MKKTTLYLFLIAFSVGSVYLGSRLYVQSQEFEKARSLVERQTEELFVLRELLNTSELKLDEVRAFLNEHYPDEDLGPYSQQIQWRGLEIYFPRDSTIAIYSSTSSDWACGTLFGCVTNYPDFLTSYAHTQVGHVLAYAANHLAYPALVVFFMVALWRMYKARHSEARDFRITCLSWGWALLVFTVFIAFGSATVWWDLVLGTGASPAILYAGWNELWLRVGLGLLCSVFLTLVGFYGQRFIAPPKNSAAAL